jgi:hypothetical protein
VISEADTLCLPALHVPALLTFNRSSYEYLALVGSFILVGLEAVIRVLTLALRELQTDSKRCRDFN